LNEQMVGRIIRHAVTMRVFHEPMPGMVAHTTASRLLANKEIAEWTRAGTEDLGPAGAKVYCKLKFVEDVTTDYIDAASSTQLAPALEKWPGSEEPNETVRSTISHTFSCG
jgi:hypothetical protein